MGMLLYTIRGMYIMLYYDWLRGWGLLHYMVSWMQ